MTIYEPAEDSYLLSRTLEHELPKLLKKNKNLRFLEMGCGSGIILEKVSKLGVDKNNISGVDINNEAVEHCCKLGFNCVRSDLFKKVKETYDVIAFNPPYLPKDKREPRGSRRETTGGKKGNEIIVSFLKQAKKQLAPKGKIFLVTSSLAEEVEFEKLGFNANVLEMEKMFFEKIFVWELQHATISQNTQ